MQMKDRLNIVSAWNSRIVVELATIAGVAVVPYSVSRVAGEIVVREHWVLGVGFAAMVVAVAVLFSWKYLRDAARPEWPRPYLVANFVGLVGFAIGGFASLSLALAKGGIVDYAATGDELHAGMLADVYLWHFADLIPLLSITETLDWEIRVESEGIAAGLLALLFKAGCIFLLLPIWRKWRAWSPGTDASASVRASV